MHILEFVLWYDNNKKIVVCYLKNVLGNVIEQKMLTFLNKFFLVQITKKRFLWKAFGILILFCKKKLFDNTPYRLLIYVH